MPNAPYIPARRSRQDRDKLVLANRGVVGMQARNAMRLGYVRRAMTLEDAFQVGMVAACRAAEIWDETRGLSFGAYCGRAAWNRICLVAAEGLISVPLECVKANYFRARGRNAGTNAYGSRQDLQRRGAAAMSPVSIEDLEGYQFLRGQAPRPDDEAARNELASIVRHGLRWLLPKQRLVIELRYGLADGGGQPLSLQEIGDVLGVSRARVQQIEAKAFERLRRAPEIRRIQGRART